MEGILGRIVAVVLGLLALAGVGVVATNAFSGNKASNVTSDITQVITNARAQFTQGGNGYTNFTTANNSALITAGIFPPDMTRGATIVDPWGNTVTIASASAASQGVISFGGGNSETAKQCVAVATSLKDFVTLSVNGTTFTPTTLPDPVSAAAACSATATFVLTFQ